MKLRLACVGLVAASVSAGRDEVSANPLGKVLDLLADLKTRIEKDGEVDEKDYNKYKCWCDEVQKSKAELIERQKKQVELLAAAIEEKKAHAQKVGQDLQVTKTQIEERTGAADAGKKNIDEAEANRQKAQAQNVQSISDLKAAAEHLSKVTSADSKASVILNVLTAQADNINKTELKQVQEHNQTVTSLNGYLNDVSAELALLKQTSTEQQSSKAEAEQKAATDAELKDDTAEQLAADEAFLKEATQSCSDRAAEYTQRLQLRSQELEGVTKAVDVLNSQKGLFAKKTSFLQLSDRSFTAQALAWLRAQSEKARSFHLAFVALQLSKAKTPEALSTVVQSIDKMVDNLKAEAKTDRSKKDFCKEEYQKVDSKVSNLGFLIQKSTAKVDKLSTELEALTTEATKGTEEAAGIDKDVKQLEELRTEQNQAFKQEEEDDKAALETLKAASDVLGSYYAQGATTVAATAVLLQAEPTGLSDKEKNLKDSEHKYKLTDKDANKGAASGILAILDNIANNLQKDIVAGKKAEEKNQLEFEQQKASLLESKDKLMKKLTSIEDLKATNSADRSQAETDKSNTEGELGGQKKYLASIKEECDWLLEKFDDRASKRSSEMDGLVRAKELLSGAALVQRHTQTKSSSSLFDYLGSD
jgi:hypothetical protein